MTLKHFIRISLLSLATISCGGGDGIDFFDNETEITDIIADDDSLRLGEATVIRTRFSFDENDVFSDGENVEVVVRIPPELKFRLNTAEIQEVGNDNEIGAQVFNCSSGEQYLLFDLNDNDLSDAENPSGDADAEISFIVDSFATSSSGVIIAANASRNVADFACGENFSAEETEVITIN